MYHMFSLALQTPPPLKIAVVTVCALFAIAKFLVIRCRCSIQTVNVSVDNWLEISMFLLN